MDINYSKEQAPASPEQLPLKAAAQHVDFQPAICKYKRILYK